MQLVLLYSVEPRGQPGAVPTAGLNCPAKLTLSCSILRRQGWFVVPCELQLKRSLLGAPVQ